MTKVVNNRINNALPSVLNVGEVYYVKKGNVVTKWLVQNNGVPIQVVGNTTFTEKIGGQFFLDTGEYNGWGVLGAVDETNNQDLGNVGASSLSRIAGGIMYPFDVRIKRLRLVHANNNANAIAFGWAIAKLTKNNSSNTQTTEWLYDEAFDRTANGVPNGNGLRNYLNNTNQITDISLDVIVEAGKVICLMAGSPSGNGDTNRYVRVQSGYFEFERL